jgi:PAS domain S-box-containing protein
MLEIAGGLFDTTGFEPRRQEGGWTGELIWLHVFSDLLIWLAFVTIPLVLLHFTRRRDLPFPRLFVLFALFILACGTTHLVSALSFEYPVHRFAGVMKALTAVASWATVIALIPVIPRVMYAVTEAGKPGADTKLHRALPDRDGSGRVRAYVVAVLAAVLALLVRASLDHVLLYDHVFVLPLLAVVYVSWRYGFRPAVVTLVVGVVGYMYLFVSPRGTLAIEGLGNQLAVALLFFCGVVCAALGESQLSARRRARAALASAVGRQDELESEVVRRRVVEAALRQREVELVAAQRQTAEALARLNAFLDNAPVGIAFLDHELRYAQVNRSMAAAHGIPPEGHVGRTVREVEPGFPPEVLAAYRRALDGDAGPATPVTAAADPRTGEVRTWQLVAFPVRTSDGRTLGLGVISRDITDRLRSEEELRHSEERFRLMAQTVPSILWTASPDGVITWVNDRWLEYCGTSAEENASGWPELVLHPDDRDRRAREWAAALAAGTEYEIEVRHRRHDGEYRWFITRAIPVRDPSGGIQAWFGATTDIHDQKEAADALRESEARFRSMADSVPALIWLTELDERRTYFNRTWLEFTGRPLERELGLGWAENIHPEDRKLYLEAYSAAFVAREPFEIEYRLRRRDGVYRWVLARGTPRVTPSGAFAGFVGLCLDVTDRREAEHALRASEERFRTLTEAVPQMVWTADTAGRVTFVNRRWSEYTGTPFEAGSGRGLEAELLHPDDAERVRAGWQLAVAKHAGGYTEEFRLRRAADGDYRWMLSSAVPRRDPAGGVTEWVGTLTDIDDQKRQTETLERMVRERTVALEAVNAALVDEVEERKAAEQRVIAVASELERSNDELEKFAYIASHDLQEPLRKIQAFGDRLLTKCRAALPDNGREYVDRMMSAAARMRRLIDDLLTFSRVTTQQRPFARLDLGKLVREVVSDLDVRITQSGATVAVGPLPEIDGDPTQMRQLFQNLIVNGVKFHRPGVPPVVEVRGELLTRPARPGEDEPVPICRLSVRDNGIGFDEKYRERIFDVFQRLHGREQYEGTGVGLAICRKIAERHGGSITAHSRPGEGATFVVTLPTRHHTPREVTADDVATEQADHDPDGRRRPG